MLAIFAKYPSPGKVKTRLAADIGHSSACSIYRAIVEQTVRTARQWEREGNHKVYLYTTGKQHCRWKDWLGDEIRVRTQKGPDLGARMCNALCDGLEEGFDGAMCVGTDVPGLRCEHIQQAADKLSRSDAVVGPSADGGYYLIGVSRLVHELFADIPWSTNGVLAATEQVAEAQDISLAYVSRLNDIDTVDELWGRAGPISVIIPTLNEAANIDSAVDRARQLGPHEVIVVDGGSTDETLSLADSAGARLVISDPGRGRQMNAGAEAATGQTLFFLHADCTPDPLSLWRIGQVFADSDAVGGAFELRLNSANPWLKIVEVTANWRSHLLGKPYGDQGIFVRKDVFRDVGGFPDWPLMEDVELARRLREAGQLKIIPVPILASARKWESGGVLRTYLTMKLTQWGYYLGVSPDSLYRFYERGRRR